MSAVLNPDTHPSRQVERIREILVGRQLETVERRLDRLETRLPPMPTAAEGDVFMICLEVFEKRHNLEVQELRDGMAADRARHTEELHRLAAQIHAVARGRSPEDANGVQQQQAEMEQRINHRLIHWQTGFSAHAQQRETYLIHEFRGELQRMREWVSTELATRDARAASAAAAAPPAAIHQSLNRLAAAAREFAETAASLHPGNPPVPANP